MVITSATLAAAESGPSATQGVVTFHVTLGSASIDVEKPVRLGHSIAETVIKTISATVAAPTTADPKAVDYPNLV